MAKKFFIDEIDFANAVRTNGIIIRDPASNMQIQGVLQEKISLSFDANWDNIFNVSERFDALRKGLSLFDVGLLNTGIFTRKYFKGGSYLKIQPKFRIVDWDGDGKVLRESNLLMNLALPSVTKSYSASALMQYVGKNTVGSTIAGIGNTAKKVVNKVGETALEFLEDPEASIDNISKLSLADVAGIKQGVKDFAKTGLGSNSAYPVEVQVSNYFKHTFVIENVSVEFSKEMTDSGPLFADIDMSLSTREVVTRGGTGMIPGAKSNSRFRKE